MINYSDKRQSIRILAITTAVILGLGTVPAYALVGDVVQTTSLEPIIPASVVFCSIGIAVDDQAVPRGYVDDCSGAVIQQINLLTGASLDTRDFSAEIPEEPNAMAYDASRGGLWICTQGPNASGMPIYFQDFQGTFGTMADDIVTLEFTITTPPANPGLNFCDGIAINLNGAGAADDRIFFSKDVNDMTEIYDVTGTYIASINNLLIDASLSSGSGLAVGGNFLYLANNGGGDVFRADLGANPLQPPFVDMFTSGDDREEDMECDPITFAPIDVMWVRTTPQGSPANNVITAYEIEPNTCGAGGTTPNGNGVAGELLSIDSTALMIAGLQSSAIWMLPILAGAVGTGAFIVRSKLK